jgi:hypothetical protein
MQNQLGPGLVVEEVVRVRVRSLGSDGGRGLAMALEVVRPMLRFHRDEVLPTVPTGESGERSREFSGRLSFLAYARMVSMERLDVKSMVSGKPVTETRRFSMT